jgi:3-oxoacyl-[acyl-carrier protein] reductase
MSDQTAKDGGDRATALVTGAASGIGQAVARHLKSRGWRVTGIDRAPVEKTEADDTHHIIADLANPDDCVDVCRAVGRHRWTALVHAAGVMRSDAHEETWRSGGAELWAVHVAAAARLAAAVAEKMPDDRGRIVLISSRAARGRAGRMLYAASKSAIDGLALSLAQDLITRGITVNVVAPGATDTPMLADPERGDAPVAMPPLGRLIGVTEIAATVGFLLGAEAGAITGQTLYQCAGASLMPGHAFGKRVHTNREDV